MNDYYWLLVCLSPLLGLAVAGAVWLVRVKRSKRVRLRKYQEITDEDRAWLASLGMEIT
jgi:uncharacterized iron-regulated membrane protein